MITIPADLTTWTDPQINAWFSGVRRDSPEDAYEAIEAIQEVYDARRGPRLRMPDEMDCGHTDLAACDLGCQVP